MSSMIKHVQIFGERCSGTNYLKSLIEKNFTGVQITKAYGGKHWFIKGHHPRGRTNRSTDYECIRSLSDSDDTLFTIIYRNPFDWLRSLHTSPYHAGNHSDLTFSQFIRKPWISFETTRMNPAWPKRDDDYYFIEEAQNILQLRTLKIRHLNTLEHVVSNVSFVNYEGLTSNNELLGNIADRFGIRLAGRPLVGETFYFGGGQTKVFAAPKQYPPISEEDLDFILESLDWDLERRIHYTLSDYLSAVEAVAP